MYRHVFVVLCAVLFAGQTIAVPSVTHRYGSDIVLRIEVHNAEEVEALADAVNILFLDVWDSNENHVDIRLAKEVVSNGQLPDYRCTSSYFNRFPHCSDYFRDPSKNHTPYSLKIYRK